MRAVSRGATPLPQRRLGKVAAEGRRLGWGVGVDGPDGIDCARMRSLQISDRGTVRGTD